MLRDEVDAVGVKVVQLLKRTIVVKMDWIGYNEPTQRFRVRRSAEVVDQYRPARGEVREQTSKQTNGKKIIDKRKKKWSELTTRK